MIHVFHGENTTASRSSLNEQIAQLRSKLPDAEILHLDGAKLAETELINALESQSMFSSDRIVHIDGLLTRRPSKEKDRLCSQLTAHSSPRSVEAGSQLNIIIWEPKQLTQTQLKPLQKCSDCQIQEFKLSKTLFAFLDSIKPNNAKQMIDLLSLTLKSEAPELVMFLLVRRVTELLLAVSRQPASPELQRGEPSALSGIKTPWQKERIVNQTKGWTIEELLSLHKKLLEIDEAIKTGSSASDLPTHLDILLASL